MHFSACVSWTFLNEWRTFRAALLMCKVLHTRQPLLSSGNFSVWQFFKETMLSAVPTQIVFFCHWFMATLLSMLFWLPILTFICYLYLVLSTEHPWRSVADNLFIHVSCFNWLLCVISTSSALKTTLHLCAWQKWLHVILVSLIWQAACL